jgi:hypothetical protein
METIYKTSRVHIVRSGYVVFSYFSEVTDMATLKATEVALRKVANEHGRLVTVTYMSGSTVTAKVPDDVKERAASMLRGLEDQLVANVMVVTGTGVGVTILRAFMTAFFIFSKIKRPQKCVADLDAALDWIRSLDNSAVEGLRADMIAKHFGLRSGNDVAARVA